jgi:hypothetical protein
MFHQFDHRFATYVSDDNTRELTASERLNPKCLAMPRYWVSAAEVESRGPRPDSGWRLAYRQIARATDERTVSAVILPLVGLANTAPFAWPIAPEIVSTLNSFAVDFAARQKVGGIHLDHFLVEQFPVLSPELLRAQASWDLTQSVRQWLTPRVLELSCTAEDMRAVERKLSAIDMPFPPDPKRRELIRIELDAAFFHLYGLERDDAEYVMDTFPIVKRKDEAIYGEYRTKRLILERYGAMSQAIASGITYKTILDPPPGHPSLGVGVSRA